MSSVAVRRVCLGALCAGCASALLGGCGAAEEGRPKSANARGRQVFGSAGCGGCHSLADAGAGGQAGPNLDRLRPSADQVMSAVRDGRAGMPSFGDRISEDDLRSLAEYVATAVGR
jgi:mono/diheme cytochrome c family protein